MAINQVNQLKPPQDQLINLLEYLNNGKYNEAEKLGKFISNKFPKHPFAWKVLGAVFSHIGRKIDSEKVNQIVVTLTPQDAEAHYNLGIVLKDLNRLEEALISYKKAFNLRPDHPETSNNIGIIFYELKKYDEAEFYLNKSLTLNPKYAEAYYNLANTLKEKKLLAQAYERYKQSIHLKPDYLEAHNNLGILLINLNRLEDAKICFENIILLKPKNFIALNNLGVVQKDLGNMEEAEINLKKAILIKPDYFDAYNNLGVIQKQLGNFEEAKLNLKKAISLNKTFVDAYCNLAMVYNHQSKFCKAKTNYNKALKLNPKNSLAKHMLNALNRKTTKTAPITYIQDLFDDYANNFEDSLINKLNYDVPNNIVNMIKSYNKSQTIGSILDLGCGTGLVGQEIRQISKNLDGIDISQKMLNLAKKKKVYDNLIKENILTFLSKGILNYDYFISADVFIYIGDLTDVFSLIKSRNMCCGHLVFSTEHYDGEGYFLEQSGRYSHSKKYIETLCNKFKFDLVNFKSHVLRKSKNKKINGGLYFLKF